MKHGTRVFNSVKQKSLANSYSTNSVPILDL